MGYRIDSNQMIVVNRWASQSLCFNHNCISSEEFCVVVI